MSERDDNRASRPPRADARRPMARAERPEKPAPRGLEELEDLLPGEPGWADFWLRVRADGDRVRSDMGIGDEAGWRDWLRELRQPPERDRARVLRNWVQQPSGRGQGRKPH